VASFTSLSHVHEQVHDIVTMGKHPNDAEAKQMLTKIAKQVQPIMRKRSWRVPRLSEFFPANANLLGLNIGGGGGNTREIKVVQMDGVAWGIYRSDLIRHLSIN